MAVENNMTKREDMVKIQSVDFVEQFKGSIKSMLEALGIVRKIPMRDGDTLKRYTSVNTLENGEVLEGELIPLSKFKTIAADPVVITLEKFRKAVTAEAIQASGYNKAVVETDQKLSKEIAKGIRDKFFANLGTGTGTATGANFQKALAKVWAGVGTVFEDDACEVVAFANHQDVADYIGNVNITVQDIFGMKYLTGFTDVKGVFITSKVEAGKIIGTAVDNICMAYIDVNGELSKAFNLTVDETGYIGLLRDTKTDHATLETVAMSGITFFAENLGGVIKATITPGV